MLSISVDGGLGLHMDFWKLVAILTYNQVYSLHKEVNSTSQTYNQVYSLHKEVNSTSQTLFEYFSWY